VPRLGASIFGHGGAVDGEFSVNLEYLLYIGFDYDLQQTRQLAY
jgi:hypothetical protein